MNKEIHELSIKVGKLLKNKNLKLVTAESCTGGLVTAAITAISGSSEYFERGFVVYSNEAKQEVLDVKKETLKKYGAVSAKAVEEMAIGALFHSKSQISIAITGIAGPIGGSKKKPTGMVYFCFASIFSSPSTKCKVFSGGREIVRTKATKFALEELIGYLFLNKVI